MRLVQLEGPDPPGMRGAWESARWWPGVVGKRGNPLRGPSHWTPTLRDWTDLDIFEWEPPPTPLLAGLSIPPPEGACKDVVELVRSVNDNNLTYSQATTLLY